MKDIFYRLFTSSKVWFISANPAKTGIIHRRVNVSRSGQNVDCGSPADCTADYECCAAQHYERKWWNRELTLKDLKCTLQSQLCSTMHCRLAYRIYSIKRPGRLFKFWTFQVGAYSRWALIRSWALIKFSPFSFYLIYTFLRAQDDNEVSVNVTGSKALENGLVVPETFKTRTPNRSITTKFEREILRLKELCAHMDISVTTLRKIPTLS